MITAQNAPVVTRISSDASAGERLRGFDVALLAAVRTLLSAFALMLVPALATGAEWSVGASAGPFFFGRFAESQVTIVNGESTVRISRSLTAKTRAGLLFDVERIFNDRVSIRFEAGINEAPLSISTDDDDTPDDGTSLEVGEMQVTTFAVPFVFRLNHAGTFRPYILAGVAYALYDFQPEESTRSLPLFEGTRGRLGVTVGAGLDWWLTRRLAIFGQTSDIYTKAPLSDDDFSGPRPRSYSIENPHNVHTTLGLRYSF